MLRWSTVWIICRREVRDQLRDKRTLFMIFVLPILLYPVMGMGILKLSTSFEQKPRTVVVVGPEFLPTSPALLAGGGERFDASLFDSPAEADRLVVKLRPAEGVWLDPKVREEATRTGVADAVVTLPADLRAQIDGVSNPEIPIEYDSADERSQITYLRLREVLSRWEMGITDGRLKAKNLPPAFTDPLRVKPVDVATEAELGSSVWAKLFPFLLVMMSLTGAFYPAVDLCAGEKERGTMETLLISPASRAEIVMGKFLTVFMASVLTALLNLASMGLTGVQLARQIGSAAASATAQRRLQAVIAPPSLESAFWIVLLLIPLAAFFSAVCLSLAVLARSMKEGQYYMTPLYLFCLPLIVLTVMPGVEINLFYSLVPVTGVSLLLRTLIQGDYDVAAKFFLPVLVPTVCYGAIALRWAVDQFQREDVLFREAERFDLKMWVRHLLRDKEATPNGGEVLFCFALMLALSWFFTQYLLIAGKAESISAMALGQIGFILTPPLAMAFLLTSSPRRTLRLNWPSPGYLLLGVGLALAFNPLVNELRPVVERFFPMSKELKDALEHMMKNVPGPGTLLVLFALIPAVCEEFAFRGFILTGLERNHKMRTAVLMSALLFGYMHVLLSLFQQLFNATLLGLVLGLLAVRSRSILPGIVFHLINNGLAVLTPKLVALTSTTAVAGASASASWLYRDPEQGLYHWWVVAAAALVCGLLLTRLRPPSTTPGPGPAAPDREVIPPLPVAG